MAACATFDELARYDLAAYCSDEATRVLTTFPPSLSHKAERMLERMPARSAYLRHSDGSGGDAQG